MPTYEYRCNKCKAVYVLSRSIDERSQDVNCVCGNNADRVFLPLFVQFRGTGFYKTDNK